MRKCVISEDVEFHLSLDIISLGLGQNIPDDKQVPDFLSRVTF